MDPIATIKNNIPRLSHPDTVADAAAAIDACYKRLWSNVYQLGTLACLRAGLLARNALYEGNAIAAIYKVLQASSSSTGDDTAAAAAAAAAAYAPVTASHLLSILAALLQDVPAAFAAEGYAHLVYDAVDESELIIPDTSELNALRAQPLFVSLALRTLLARPSACDRDPHVSVGYINDLISIEGLDYITSAAMQGLLRDRPFREVLFRGLASPDPHKLFKCLQLLKRCVGGGPGMLGGFANIHHELSPPWSLQQLLQLGAQQPLVAACSSVAQLVQQHGIERQLLGLLHTTLLDIFDLLCAADAGSSSKGGGGGAGGSSSGCAAKQAAAPAPAGEKQIGQAAASHSSSSSSSSSSGWPDDLVAAHMGVVIEVARLVPFLITSLERMQPYAATPAAAAALEAAGPGAAAALLAVLAAGDATDWPMLPHEVDGYKVLTALTKQSRQLALAALSAGAARTIYAALVKWAAVMPAPDALPGTEPQTPDSETQLNELYLDPAVRHAHRRSGSSGSSGLGTSGVRPASPFDQGLGRVVDPQVVRASAAALQLLHTLLASAAQADQRGSSSSAAPAAAVDFHMPEDLPALLLELWHVQPLQRLAADCLAALQQLGLLAAAAGGHGEQQQPSQPITAAAAAGSQALGMLVGSVAAATGQVAGLGVDKQQAEVEGACGVQESSRLMAQLKV
uniref:Uncharacterized protein n=1 Tax=Tetradesmus obliquus TaxID=3088 RepID=A0A383VSG5_TETOB